ncbi:phosphatase 2C-like domain-containing protein [Phlebopus sp. FC_14]|nr:phosphatase 2C-like domain-containing protein [Phlebopus sp. FC_14]
MSPPGPTMKTIQKRFYTALPRTVSSASSSTSISRVRSNSASSARSLYTANSSSGPLAFFDSPPPPPPSSRPGNPHVLSTSRLPVKGEGEGPSHSTGPHSHNSPHGQGQTSGQPPFSLALTSPQASSSPPHLPASYQSSGFFPYSFSPLPFYNVSLSDHSDSHPRVKRQRMRYHMDVGAYGIPKRSSGHVKSGMDGYGSPGRSSGRLFQGTPIEDLSLAVQVGEDAYFIRENAMGVADGVGGWSRAKDPLLSKHTSQDPSPSALFARRLMHHCSAETLDADVPASRRREVSPGRSVSPQRNGNTASADSWSWNDVDELNQELEDSLEELEDGLDILMILERAYEQTIKAHVVTEPSESPSSPPATTPGAAPSLTSIPEDAPLFTLPDATEELPKSTSCAEFPPSPKTVPLMTGSSTALVAVLQHSHALARAPSVPSPMVFHSPTVSPTPSHDAVLKIAHLGDCMGMLVRDEQVVWRSTEMWWAFNTPVQLGPSSSARPRDAQIVELPVQADDILILASDGLSDNLWDAEVLDEVIRFKRSFLRDGGQGSGQGLLGRRTLAGMLSEALCSRARRVSERKGKSYTDEEVDVEDEVPFARRAREQGKSFRGGKIDDISVLVAVISPAPEMVRSSL